MKKDGQNTPVHINVITWTHVETLPYKETSKTECANYINMLERLGLNVTQRTKRGRKIGGACGQLGKTLKNSD